MLGLCFYGLPKHVRSLETQASRQGATAASSQLRQREEEARRGHVCCRKGLAHGRAGAWGSLLEVRQLHDLIAEWAAEGASPSAFFPDCLRVQSYLEEGPVLANAVNCSKVCLAGPMCRAVRLKTGPSFRSDLMSATS